MKIIISLKRFLAPFAYFYLLMKNLILDQGNSYLKVALFSKGKLLRRQIFHYYSLAEVLTFLGEDQPDHIIISSVGNSRIFHEVHGHFGNIVYQLSHQQPLPFNLKYATPETLGLDRMALAAAAVGEFDGRDCLVIDAGTCITYDFVDRNKNYLGGAIAPGLQMRYRALEHFTARLPLVEHQHPQDLIGNSTTESIRSGVVNGIIAEVTGTIAEYQKRFPDVQVIITGGDMEVFEPLVKNGIFAAPNFLLTGLNNIVEYYAEVL